jgi:glycosyltransferase involved in cell wall biosynthesis
VASSAQSDEARPRQPLPKISCLMVTKGNLFPAHFAIECFQRQTYPNRELIVVCDRPGNEVGEWIGTLNDPSIRYVESDRPVLGALRNLSMDVAEGQLLCQWDDDDLYHPRRLEVQIRQMAKHKVPAHFLSHWILWWPRRRLLAISSRRDYWEGSMLVHRRVMTRYPELRRGEDTPVVDSIVRNHRFAATRNPGLYCYVIHGNNTWDEAHLESLFQATREIVPPARYDEQVRKLSELLPMEAYAAELAAMDLQPERL